MSQVPPYIGTGEVARAAGMSTKAARAKLERAGILEQDGRYGKVGASRLRERLPELYDRVYDWFVLGGSLVAGEPGSDRDSPGATVDDDSR